MHTLLTLFSFPADQTREREEEAAPGTRTGEKAIEADTSATMIGTTIEDESRREDRERRREAIEIASTTIEDAIEVGPERATGEGMTTIGPPDVIGIVRGHRTGRTGIETVVGSVNIDENAVRRLDTDRAENSATRSLVSLDARRPSGRRRRATCRWTRTCRAPADRAHRRRWTSSSERSHHLRRRHRRTESI